MKKLLLSLSLVLSSHAFSASYVVEMKKVLTKEELQKLSQVSHVLNISKFTTYQSEYFNRLYVINSTKDIKSNLTKLKNVALVEENFEAEFFEVKENPNSERLTDDLLFAKQWALYSQGQIIVKQTTTDGPSETPAVKGIDIDWKNSIDAIEKKLKKTPVVAVVDMGIDLDHPELKDQIFKNDKECDENGNPLPEKLDRDENKFSSDCHGWDFAAIDPNLTNFPLDDKGHGTHVAGIIAAKKNNKLGISGVSDKIKILPVRVTGSVDETSDKNKILMRAPSQRIANGILYSVYRGVDVINLSLGWPKAMDTNFMRKAIGEANARGIVVVAAAGNNNTNANIYPCSYYDVVCVGSVDADGAVSNFSNYGGEVDILAPGDQILSTIPTTFIPLKMNIQGYDIMSGTSQAAPYVSAVAALLKGLDPEVSRDEILRKMYDSARARPDNFKSMHGIVQLGKAANLTSAPSTKPIFKMLTDVTFNPANGYFMFALNLRNYGVADENVRIDVEAVDPAIEIRFPNFDLEKIETGKPATLKVEGRILDQTIDHKVRLKVTVSSEKQGSNEYFQDLFFSRNILQDDDVKTFGFSFVKDQLPLISYNKENNTYSDNTRSVDTLYNKSAFPDFTLKYQPSNPKDDSEDGIRIYLMKHDGTRYVEVKKSYFVYQGKKLLSITKNDYNYDGKDDYEVSTIVYPKEGAGYILYSYLDENFEPLLGEFSDIKYRPRYVEIPNESVRYMKTKLPNGMYLATRYFMNTGVIPAYDQVHDEWTKDDLSSRNRLYYLSLENDEDGKPSFNTHTIYNQDFEKKVNAFVPSNLKGASMEILNYLTQDEASYKEGKITALASYGLGYRRSNFFIDIVNGEVSLREANYVTQRLDMNAHHAVYDLNDNIFKKIRDVFVGFLTTSLVKTVTVDKSTSTYLSYEETDKVDRLVSFMAQYDKGDKRYSVLETIDSILLVTDSSEGRSISRKRTKKFSFLPGAMMSEIYYPIAIDSKEGLIPAIYVDSVLISGNQVYVSTVKDNKLVSPMNLSVFIPNGCVPKNPTVGESGGFSYTVLCRGKEGYEVKFMELNLED